MASASVGVLLSGCGYAHINRDSADRPERSTGSAARVVMPGEPMPAIDEPLTTGEPVQLGGSSAESDVSIRDRDVPLGPLAVLFGYPFWLFGKTVSEEADEAVDDRASEEQAQRGSQVEKAARQRQLQQERLERENARMREALRRGTSDSASYSGGPSSGGPESTNRSRAAGPTGASPGDDSRGLQRELAALQRSIERRRASASPSRELQAVPVAPPSESAPLRESARPAPTADPRSEADGTASSASGEPSRVEDRDGDGRPDRWLFGSAERPARELLDQNGDGRADLVRHFDDQQRLVRTEEDLDFDGRFEVTTQFHDGRRSRRLEDTDGDGQADRWTYFQNGELRRIESDSDADGFRDSVSLYRDGSLAEQQLDQNGDGQPDRLERYRAGETVEVHEDLDGDGALDVASYYEGGKLVRRELRSEEVLQRWSGDAPAPVSSPVEREP